MASSVGHRRRFDVGDVAVRLFLPDVEHVAVLVLAVDQVAVDVALLVERDVAQHRVEHLAGVYHRRDLLAVERLRGFRRLLVDLHDRVAVERVGLRLEPALLAKEVDDRLVLGVGARIGREGHQRAFGAGTRDRGELVVGDAVAAHQRRFEALVAHLAQDEAAGVLQATPVDQVGIDRFELGDEGGEILVVLVDALEEHYLHAVGIERLARFLGETLAVGRLVVHEGDLLALEPLRDDRAGDAALLVVAAAHAEDVPHLAIGDLRVGGGGRDLEDAVLLVDFRGRDGDAGVEVADHELDAVGGEFVGDGHAFLRVGAVVADLDHELLAEDAAGLVDVGDRLLGTLLELGAEGRVAAGHRAGDTDLDVGRGVARHGDAEAQRKAERLQSGHAYLPAVAAAQAELEFSRAATAQDHPLICNARKAQNPGLIFVIRRGRQGAASCRAAAGGAIVCRNPYWRAIWACRRARKPRVAIPIRMAVSTT